MRKPVIGVMGGHEVDEATLRAAHRLGELIARRGWILLNGGRNVGVMAASSAGARQAGGTVIGILPDRDASRASPDLDYAVITGLGESRNVINVLSSDVVIACPGGAGTLSEVTFALIAEKPVILLGFDPGPSLSSYRARGLLYDADSPETAITLAETLLIPPDGSSV